MDDQNESLPPALAMLHSKRPRNVNWFQAAALLFGDWGTSRLYVLGLAFLVAGRSSFWIILGMSLLMLAVGWAYTQICRIYPDGGGVYTAAKQYSRLLGVIGALLLFADYTVTASLSAVDAFHYFGLGQQHIEHVQHAKPGDDIRLHEDKPSAEREDPGADRLFDWHSPGLWAIISILAIGALNLLGPKHTAGFALVAAAGMVVITLLVVIVSLPNLDWQHLDLGTLHHNPLDMWQAFVFVVLALSGVETIANFTGVLKKPVYKTARKAIWVVAVEVAVFNLVLALAMVALASGPTAFGRHEHTGDMMAFIAQSGLGAIGEWPVRIIGGLLLLSASNTAVNGLMSITYVMSRDGEMPKMFQWLNPFGAPWVGALVAAAAPAIVLLFAHDLETLASLYAIGVVGAVAINCSLCTFHPRLRPWRWMRGELAFPRRIPMALLGVLLIAIWITLAFTKLHALIFVCVVLVFGLTLRRITQIAARRKPKPSLLRQAIVEQISPDAWTRPRIMLATAGSSDLADEALEVARAQKATLVVAFIREVALNYRVEAERQLTLDTDPAAQTLFANFLAEGHKYGVPIIPVYDTGPNGAELVAEQAAMNGVTRVLIGSSRRGALHHLIKGSFQRRLEGLLPPEVKVEVLTANPPEPSVPIADE
jgi:amino acid transporter/nucleotide-binding universal stress UspA family protein